MRTWLINCVGAVDPAHRAGAGWRLVHPAVWAWVAAWLALAVYCWLTGV